MTELLINEQIRDKEVRLIDTDGMQLGIVPNAVAKKLAEERNLDLVKIAPDAKPPVCKIINYSKFRYEQIKKEKEARKKQKIVSVKEIRLSINIDTHDLEVKIKKALEIIESGNKVKLSVRFRGRELNHTELAHQVLKRTLDYLSDSVIIEKNATFEGRSLFVILTPANTK